MNKQAMILIKTAGALKDPRVPDYVKQLAVDYIKTAGFFDSAANAFSSIAGGIGNIGSSFGSSIGGLGSSLAGGIASGITAMLPTGITWENIADVLKRSDPEIASMSSDPNFMAALKQAVSEMGSLDQVLSALGLK